MMLNRTESHSVNPVQQGFSRGEVVIVVVAIEDA